MGLTIDLSASLDAGALGGTLSADLSGPTSTLSALELPVDAEGLSQITSGTADIDTSGVSASVSILRAASGPILQSLPLAADIVGPISQALQVTSELTEQGVAERFRALGDRLNQELDISPEGGRIAMFLRLAEALGEDDGIFGQILGLVKGQAGTLPILPLGDALRAVDGSVRALGGMMALESVLAEGERLMLAMAGALDSDTLAADLVAVETLLDGGGISLASAMAAAQPGDLPSVRAAIGSVGAVAVRLEEIRERLSAAMGLGEATLVYMDIDQVQLEVTTAAAVVRSADLGPLKRLVADLAPQIGPWMTSDLAGVPRRGLDTLLTDLEGLVAERAAQIDGVDVAEFVAPLTEGIDTLVGFLDRINDVIEGVVGDFRAAMEAVRQGVAALPVGDIADAIQTFLGPVTTVIGAVTDFIADIESALQVAADTTEGALGLVDEALDRFKDAIDALFADARALVDQADLDAVMGEIAGKIQDFADVLAKAQMKPYFDTAVDVIGTTADVVSKVPLDLLPEDMKADLDEAVRPIKQTDIRKVESDLESVLQIGPDGKFQLRGDVEAAIADVQVRYDELIAAVKAQDPRVALAAVDAELEALAARVREIDPGVTLQPVREALDQVKGVLEGLDLDALLDPVRKVFDDIIAGIDAYSPAALVAPLEEELDRVRTELLEEIRFSEWSAVLDDLEQRAASLLDVVDPAQLEGPLRGGLEELLELAEGFPDLGGSGSIGTVVASLLKGTDLPLSPASFTEVTSWIGGESGSAALADHASSMRDAIVGTRDAVQSLDVESTGQRITTKVNAVAQAMRDLANSLPEGSSERIQLTATLPRLDAQGMFAELTLNRSRYLQRLTRAAGLADLLARTGYSEVDLAVTGLRDALAPLRPLREFLEQILDILGLASSDGIAGMARTVLRAAPPERIVGIVMPIFVAIRNRLIALMDAIFEPVRAGLDELQRLIDTIDLTPLREAIEGVVDEVKAQVLRLHPNTLLAEPVAAFEALRAALVDSDPLETIETILENVRELIATVLEKVDPETLLEAPLAIYDQILEQLEALNLEGLLDPVFDQLDAIATQVDVGLDDTVIAFERLQAALPSGGGGSSASASVSVG